MIWISWICTLYASIFTIAHLGLLYLSCGEVIRRRTRNIFILIDKKVMRGLNIVDDVVDTLMFIIILRVLPLRSLFRLFLIRIEVNLLQNNRLSTSRIRTDLILLLNYYNVMIFNPRNDWGLFFADWWSRLFEGIGCWLYVGYKLFEVLFIVAWGFAWNIWFLLNVWKFINSFLVKLRSIVTRE